jgi:GMP synthase (glutamine-hydrolysing)
VKRAKKMEYGITEVIVDKRAGILRNHGKTENVWTSHGDTVLSLPDDLEVLAHTRNCPVAAFRHKVKPIHGVQWHPEVAHTLKGQRLLKNFVFDICGCRATWTPENLVERSIREVRGEGVGQNKVPLYP